EEVDGDEYPHHVAQRTAGGQPAPAAPALEDVVGHEHQPLIEPVDEVLRLQAVTAPHQAHGEHQRDVMRALPVAAEPATSLTVQHEAHVDVIAQPPGERDVPPVPDLAKAAAHERGIEVLRHLDPEEAADTDGERAVAGEVEEEIQAERV